MDAIQYRPAGEEEYVKRMAALDLLVLASLAGRIDVNGRAMRFAKPQLSVAFRFFENVQKSNRSNFVRQECRTGSGAGYAVLY